MNTRLERLAGVDLSSLYGDVIVMDRPGGDEVMTLTGISENWVTVNRKNASLSRIIPLQPVSRKVKEWLMGYTRRKIKKYSAYLSSGDQRESVARKKEKYQRRLARQESEIKTI